MRKIFVVLIILFSAVCVSAEEKNATRFEKVVNRMVKAINDADYPAAQADFAKVMLDFLPLDKSKPFFENLSAQYGKFKKLDAPRLIPPLQAIFVAHLERGILDIKIWLDEEDKITGFQFLPHVPDIQVPEKNRTQLTLPFKGSWLVFWGGDTKELNQHHGIPNQKFAFDFLVVDETGKTHKGDGTANKDYYAFGMELSAPAGGVVMDVINGVRDNR